MDSFALLGQVRRPWIDTEELKDTFLELSGESHPDRVLESTDEGRKRATEHYARLNAAYACLRISKERLRHLIEIERGEPPGNFHDIDSDLADLFSAVGTLCRRAQSRVEQQRNVNSPLLRAQCLGRNLELLAQIQKVLGDLDSRLKNLDGELFEMNRIWAQAPPVGHPDRGRHLPLERLETVGHLLGYIGRWKSELQHLLVGLSS